jgi:D-arabinose 1-dehydrogenase-like Zn-dependent alcohol dehydrogenase
LQRCPEFLTGSFLIIEENMLPFNKVTIIGVGLIGGSLAQVLKEKDLAREITGAGRSRETLELALKLGVIDRMGQALSQAVGGAEWWYCRSCRHSSIS